MKRNSWITGLFILVFILLMTVGAYGSTKAVKLATPAIKSIEVMDNSYIEIKWSKINKAQGYQIYRLDSNNGGYKKIATVKANVLKDRNVADGRKYSYKVRAYSKTSGKMKYSKFSAADRIVFEDVFQKLLDEANKTHTEMNTNREVFKDISSYAVSDTSTAELLSDSETDSLLQEHSRKAVSRDAAKADIDLYFRTLRSSYTAYYYFGADNFEKAEKNIIRWIDSQQGEIKPNALCNQINKEMQFVQDAHFSASDTWRRTVSERFYNYYYFTDNVFVKDGNKYTTKISGKKYTFKSFSAKTVKLRKTLLADGRIAYVPSVLCRDKQLPDCSMILTDAAGKNRKVNIKWEKSSPYSESFSAQDYHYFEDSEISYVSIRSFNSRLDANVFQEFENSAQKMKKSSLIIFDIRANGGGNDGYAREWIENFSGHEPVVNSAFARRNSKLSSKVFGNDGSKFGIYTASVRTGQMIPNDIPVIVLVDNKCGSSGESMLNFLRCLDNVIIVGSNSAGYQLSGNVHQLCLPNTGIHFAVTMGSLHFNYNTEPVDYKGYDPDIWCDPKDALDAVFNMVRRNAAADKSGLASLQAAVNEIPKPITLRFGPSVVREGENFGASRGVCELVVLCGGKEVHDFTVEAEDNGVCRIGKTEGGKIRVEVTGKGECRINVKYKGKEAEFIWSAL